MIAESRILRQIAMIDLTAYASLTKKMETLNHARFDFTRRNGNPDGRTVRFTPSSSGARSGRSECCADQDRDGETRGSPGGAIPRRGSLREDERPTRKYGGELAEGDIGYRVDLSDSRATGISRGELLNCALSAVHEVFPGETAELKLDHGFVLRLCLGGTAIAIVPDGKIVGRGDPERITQLLDALALRIPMVAVEPDPEDECVPNW
ncbi:hypothetical protein MUY35_02940 [Aliiroseovarius sp. S1339]|uniref:hypothetical protein n=1 Tax=Aliiroseovarius sp. S1339 TaxID=2936990 RepID=UPI0020BFA7F3|nr:hypothetical protein [Aliiroseovarius sp. S1339]MCK8462804.1 hypothetical protein [Aliiroseovarius sp. S1339]